MIIKNIKINMFDNTIIEGLAIYSEKAGTNVIFESDKISDFSINASIDSDSYSLENKLLSHIKKSKIANNAESFSLDQKKYQLNKKESSNSEYIYSFNNNDVKFHDQKFYVIDVITGKKHEFSISSIPSFTAGVIVNDLCQFDLLKEVEKYNNIPIQDNLKKTFFKIVKQMKAIIKNNNLDDVKKRKDVFIGYKLNRIKIPYSLVLMDKSKTIVVRNKDNVCEFDTINMDIIVNHINKLISKKTAKMIFFDKKTQICEFEIKKEEGFGFVFKEKYESLIIDKNITRVVFE